MATKLRPAIFLDRDGVLNADAGYTYRVEDLQLLEGVPEALRVLHDRGFLLVVISNQSGVARGYFDDADVERFHKALSAQIAAQGGAAPDAFFYCPHLPDAQVAAYKLECNCRKPHPGLVLTAATTLGIDLAASYMVGDRESDIACAVAAGVRPIQVVAVGNSPDRRALAAVGSLAQALPYLVIKAP